MVDGEGEEGGHVVVVVVGGAYDDGEEGDRGEVGDGESVVIHDDDGHGDGDGGGVHAYLSCGNDRGILSLVYVVPDEQTALFVARVSHQNGH